MQASAYKTTIDYLFKQLPMFHRIGAAAYKANLDNTHALMQVLNQPQQSFKSIHIAGTNGKGSTSHMLASILQHAGYKVGLYTSPHLKDFRERIKINGKPISKNYVVDFVESYKVDFEKIQPSFFEWTVGLCFDYFRNQQIDIAVIETGLGGRLDSTNVVSPLLSVITNIGYDHMALLGNTFSEIAIEKAGIIKSKTPVVIGKYQNTTAPVFKQKAKSEQAPIHFASKKFHAHFLYIRNGLQYINITAGNNLRYKKLALDLTGTYQLENVTTVLTAVVKLQCNFKIDERAIRNGLKTVVKTTGLMGRWQTIQTKPLVICDTGHNVDGITYVIKNIRTITYNKLHIVIGMVADKDVSHILKLFPSHATYYYCAAKLPRALPAKALQALGYANNLNGKAYVSVNAALKAAKKAALPNDFIFVGGSTFTVAEAL